MSPHMLLMLPCTEDALFWQIVLMSARFCCSLFKAPRRHAGGMASAVWRRARVESSSVVEARIVIE